MEGGDIPREERVQRRCEGIDTFGDLQEIGYV